MCRYPAGRSRSPWLDGTLAAPEPTCRRGVRLVALSRRSVGVRCELDRWFDQEVGALASPCAERSPYELAELWSRERARLRGAQLAALLWTLSRRSDLPARQVAERIASGLDSRRLLEEPHPV